MAGVEWTEAVMLAMTLAALAIMAMTIYYQRTRRRFERRDLDAYVIMEQALTSQQRRYDQQAARLDEMERQRMSDHQLILELYKRIATLENYLSIVVGHAQKAGVDLPPLPDALKTPVAAQIDKRVLRQRLATLFDMDELASLMFDIGIDDEQLSGRTREARARELVEYADRHGMLNVLAEAVERLRPVK